MEPRNLLTRDVGVGDEPGRCPSQNVPSAIEMAGELVPASEAGRDRWLVGVTGDGGKVRRGGIVVSNLELDFGEERRVARVCGIECVQPSRGCERIAELVLRQQR